MGTGVQAVAYLDLLGFSAAVESNNGQIAGSLLSGYNTILQVMHFDKQAENPEATGLEKRYLERGSRFTTVLPMSDSIFLASDNLSDLVFGVAWLLAESYTVYSNHEVKDQPPVLFRGGIATGSCHEITQTCIRGRAFGNTTNVAGDGVVAAVNIEKQLQSRKGVAKGPRVWLTRALAETLDADVRYLVSPASDDDEMCDLLWPRATMFGIDLRFDVLAAENFFHIATEGQTNYAAHKRVAVHYHGLLALTERSARCDGVDEGVAQEWLHQHRQDWQTPMPTELEATDRETANLLMSFAWQAYENRMAHYDKLDAKAAVLASFVGISISLSAGPLAHVPRRTDIVDAGLATLLVLLLLFAMAHFVLALKTRAVRDLISPNRLREYVLTIKNKEDRPRLLTKEVALQVARVSDDLRAKIDLKVKHIARGVVCLQALIVLAFVLFLKQLGTTQ
jgi:hypothetical protein